MDETHSPGPRSGSALWRWMGAGCTAAAAGLAVLVAAATCGALYLALDEAGFSPSLILRGMPQLVCSLVPACAAR